MKNIGYSGLTLIKSFEGYSETAYLCPAGVPTIGWGSTTRNGKPVEIGTTITQDEATEELKKELEIVEKTINEVVIVDLSQNEFDALCSFVYNVGISAFKQSTLLKKLNVGDKEGAANEFLRWNKASGKVLTGLTRRRVSERELFLLKSV